MVCERLRLETQGARSHRWEAMRAILQPKHEVRIAVVGKYTELHDAYKSVQEALIHGGIANDARVEIEWLASEGFTIRRRPGRRSAGTTAC